jgi:DNA-binding transcriptional LysR family regulator
MDKLRAMATFVRIVEAGSLTGAAERMATSLTSVVRSLAALERALGVRLLNRSTRRLALTDEGREYFERCRRLLAEVEEAEAALTARQLSPAGRLAITAPVMFGRLHVGPVVSDFLAVYPALRVELLLLDRVVDLLEEGIDLAVRIGELPDSSLVALPLGSTRRIVCASPAYLAGHGSPRSPAELAGHRCIRFTGLSPGQEWEFAGEGPPQRVAVADILATNHIDAALDACVKGLGCGRFLAYQARELIAAGALVRILPGFEPPPVPVSLVYPHSRLLSSRVRAFIERAVPALRECLRERG